MPKRVATGEYIISELRRRLAALGYGHLAGVRRFRLVPADADRNGGCNWTIAPALAELPADAQAAVRHVMHYFNVAPAQMPAGDSLAARKLRADLAFLEWQKTVSLWRLALQNPFPLEARANALRNTLIRRMRQHSGDFIEECQAAKTPR